MKVQIFAGVLLAGAVSLSTPAFAQASDTATANGSTTIIRPVETPPDRRGRADAFGQCARYVPDGRSSGSITVTTIPSLNGSTVLPGTLGSAGSASVQVGGSFPLTANTPTGSYFGNFPVVFQYN